MAFGRIRTVRFLLLVLALVITSAFAGTALERTASASLLEGVARLASRVSLPIASSSTAKSGDTRGSSVDNAYGSSGDRIIVGQGNGLAYLSGSRRDKLQIIQPSGTPLPLSAIDDFEPQWSADGKKIVFVSLRDAPDNTNYYTRHDYRSIYTMNADGSDQTRIFTSSFLGPMQPTFSPDGNHIAFLDNGDNLKTVGVYTGIETDIDISECTSSGMRNTVRRRPGQDLIPGIYGPHSPDYSPDGNHLIYVQWDSALEVYAIFRVPTDGSGGCTMIYASNDDVTPISPQYSPDGTKIALYYVEGSGNPATAVRKLRIINAVTGATIQDHLPPGFFGEPVWSPDGTKIAYPIGQYDEIAEYEVRGYGVRTYDLTTADVEDVDLTGFFEGINGLHWGVPTTTVPTLSMRINSPHPLASGSSTTGTLYFADPAPPGGTTVTLSTLGAIGAITVPASVVIPEGETTVNFPITSEASTLYRTAGVLATRNLPTIAQAEHSISLHPARPDLLAVSFTAPATTTPGASNAVSWTVQNIGPVTTSGSGSYSNTVYFSVDNVLSNDDTLLRTISGSVLAAGASQTQNSTATISANLIPASGSYFLIFATNPANSLNEGGQTANNQIVRQIQVNTADLVVENLVVPPTVEPGVSYSLTFNVRNAGNATTGASFSNQIFYSEDNTAGNADDISVISTFSISTLAAGATSSQTRNVNIPTVPVRPNGPGFFYVKTDAGNAIAEGTATGETNNITFATTTFDYRVADMQVTASSAPADVDTDTVFSLSWTTANAGNRATTANLVDRVYFSTDQTVGSDTILGSFTLTGGLAAGATADRIQNITIPYANVPASGPYYLLVQTDQSDIVNEGVNEGNNVRVQPIYVRKALRPDLIVTNVTGPPTVFFDQTVQVQWTVTNNGTGPTNAPQWKDALYIGTSPTSTSGATKLAEPSSITALNPGESYTATATVKIPRGISGAYYFHVRTNSNSAVNETSTANNLLSRAVAVNVPPLPDLTVETVQAPDEVFAGQPISISYTIRNIGTDDAIARKDRIYLSRDTTLNTSQDRLIFTSDELYGPTAGNATTHTSQNRVGTQNPPTYQLAYLPSDLEGLWYVFVVTDYQNTVYEYTGENNNTGRDIAEPGAPMNILVTPPDLVIPGQPTAPATVASGGLFSVEFTVRNQGAFVANAFLYHAVYLSTDATFEASTDTLLGTYYDRDPFGPGAEHPVTLNVATPYCLPNGTYYLFAVADYNGRQFEFDPGFDAEANNASAAKQITLSTIPPDLQVTNFTVPAITTPGGTVPVSWTVANTGSATALRWFDRVYLNSLTPGVGSVLIGSFERTGGLAAGGSYTETRAVGLPAYMQGDYYLSIGTDSTNNVPECGSSESNNSAQSANFTVQNNLPDLVIDTVTAPTSATVGDTFNVSWVGRNANQPMPPNSSTFRDTVYLSSDTSLSSGDIAIGSALNNVILGSGQTYPQQSNVSMGNVAPGTYYILVAADTGRNIYEGTTDSGFESNNVRASAAITMTAPAVDLTVGSVSMSAPQYSGTYRDFSWTVTNVGTTPTLASSWSDYVILSRDSILDPSDTTLGYRTRTGALAGGANYVATASFFVPVGLTGTYTIFVVTDRNNSVVESNIANNTSSPVTVNLVVPPPAELNITNITPPASVNVGGVASFSWTVQNTGVNPVEGQWRDTFYLSRDQFWDASDILVGVRDFSSQTTSVPAGGGTYSGIWSGALPPVEEGSYYVIVRTDAQNRIRESNEANNVTSSVSTTTVSVTQLTLNTPLNTTLGNGAQLFFKYVTDPAETLVFTLDTNLPQRSNEVFTKFDTMVSRANYDFQSSRPGEGDQENFIPETEEGDYYSMVRTDLIPESFAGNFDKNPAKQSSQAGGSVPDQNITVEAKILPFSIRTIEPETAGNGGYATLLIKGAKFEQGATVKLVGPTGTEILPVMHRVSTAKIASLFDLKSKAPGIYDVVVTNPGGATTQLADGFTITAGGGHQLSEFTQGPRAYRAGLGGRFRYTLSARNDGNNDAINVPFIIDLPKVNYELDRSNIFDLPASAFLPGTQLPLPTHFDVGDRRVIILLIPILRARSSINFGISLNIPSSLNSYSIQSVTLPPLGEIFEAGSTQADGQQNTEALIRSLANRAPQASINADCWAELVRQLAYLVLGQLLKRVEAIGDCGRFLLGLVSGVSDTITGGILSASTGGQTDQVGAAFTFSAVMANFIGRVADSGLDCATDVINTSIPWYEAVAISISVAQLMYQLYQCLQPLGIKYVVLSFTSLDPNEKIGPAGYGGERFVPDKVPIPYRINFENLATATAPAQKIFISDQLPLTLDPRTVRIKEIGFKQEQIVVPDNQASYQARIQLGADLNNLQVDVLAGLDLVNRRVFWTMQAIDPETGEAPLDPLVGLLPPNNANRDGEGYVTFTVEPTAGQPTRTDLINNATIVFDANEPIITNTVSNLLDSGIPTSQLSPLPPTSTIPIFDLEWIGNDDATGSGLKGFDVLYSEDGAAYAPYVLNSQANSIQFAGKWGKLYRFHTRARDNAGNIEAAPTTPDAVIQVFGGDTEGDVAPRPNGSDGSLTGDDITQVRRFVAALDVNLQYNELQRADTAPRNDGGNGALTIADVIQARRFASGLDPVPEALGPNEILAFSPKNVPGRRAGLLPREIKPVSLYRAGNKVIVAVDLEAQGDEVAAGFALNFDPAVLSSPSPIELGPDAAGAVLTINDSQAAAGKLGIAIDRTPTSPFAAGSRRLLYIAFDVAPGHPPTTNISFTSDPVVSEVVDGTASTLATAFTAANVSLLVPTSAGATIEGTVTRAGGAGLSRATVVLSGANGARRSVLTNGFGRFRFDDVAVGETYTIDVRAKGMVFRPRLITVTEDISGIEIGPEP